MATVPDGFDAKAIIASSDAELQVGDTWYLVSITWFGKFKEYFGLKNFAFDAVERDSSSTSSEVEGSHPGPIDNMPLFDESSGKLKRCLVDK